MVVREPGIGAVAGRVTDHETGDPFRGLVVTVADVDTVRDDTLGSATTGASCSCVCRLVVRRALTDGRSNDDPDRRRAPRSLLAGVRFKSRPAAVSA